MNAFDPKRVFPVHCCRRLLRTGKRLLTDPNYRLAWLSGLFDARYYLRQYADIDPA